MLFLGYKPPRGEAAAASLDLWLQVCICFRLWASCWINSSRSAWPWWRHLQGFSICYLFRSIMMPVMLIKISGCTLEEFMPTHWTQCRNPRFPAMAEVHEPEPEEANASLSLQPQVITVDTAEVIRLWNIEHSQPVVFRGLCSHTLWDVHRKNVCMY